MPAEKEHIEEMPEEVTRYLDNPDAYFDAEEYYSIADYFETKVDLDNAFKVLGKGISIYNQDFPLQFEYARLHVVSGEYDSAEKLLYALLHGNFTLDFEERLDARTLLAKLHVEEGDLLAIQNDMNSFSEWTDGIKWDLASESFTDYASTLFQNCMYKQAIEILETGLKKHPNEVSFLEMLAECHIKNKEDYKSALEACEKAIDIDSYNASLWLKLGYIHIYNENYDEAIKAFDYATSIDGEKREAWKVMGDCLYKKDNFEDAAECYIKAISPDSDDNMLLTEIGDAYNKCGKYNKAREYLIRALDTDGDNAATLFNIGLSYFLDEESDRSNIKKSLFWFKRAVNEDDTNSLYWAALAHNHHKTGNHVSCIFAAQKSLNINPSQPFLLTILGESYLMFDEYADALEALLSAKKHGNETAQLLYDVAVTYYGLKDFTNAKYYMMQAMRLTDSTCCDSFLELHPDATTFIENVKKLI